MEKKKLFFIFCPVSIIRKTKCSGLFERSDISRKTKRPLKNHFPERLKRHKKALEIFIFPVLFYFKILGQLSQISYLYTVLEWHLNLV